jgi:hypothetical protein
MFLQFVKDICNLSAWSLPPVMVFHARPLQPSISAELQYHRILPRARQLRLQM